LNQDGFDFIGTCPVCRSGTLRLQRQEKGGWEASCSNCRPGDIRDWVRMEKIRAGEKI